MNVPARLRTAFERAYEGLLRREISGAPKHVAIIQDGNRRYARKQGEDTAEGYQAGADTTERVLDWCAELGVEELTLYAFSTENFERPEEQLQPLFDLLEGKLREFADADRVHEQEVRVRALGDVGMLPERVREAVDYAEARTVGHEGFTLNIALAYGGRNELLGAVHEVAEDVADGSLAASDVDVAEVESRLYRSPVRDVDLIIRTGGDERTSNFLPWHANGNEAAVFFCTPYWPEFSKVDLLRGIRTYEAREESWRRARTKRAVALVRSLAATETEAARAVAGRLRETLPSGDAAEMEEVLESSGETAD
ncbi:polyprenyl diphosphate synthase [Halorarum halobium]|uniref:polyprenyl diphosphate synthase n=1 Tax=Halorarum halobium TaxID=3075121 RepID=UPI0028A7C5FB|nr:polyprenyl diphosphate synthase [Halobaculum sp. XH14]